MSQPPMELPDRILLATDLSPRCDRAIERSLQLATQWNAKLIAFHCLETASEPLLSAPIWDTPVLCGTQDSQWFAQRRLQGDLDAFGGTATIVITLGDPGPAIGDAARKDECDLIVAGPSRAETLWTSILGSTTDHLLRHARVPVLIVRNHGHMAYQRIVAATDFSSRSGHALASVRQLLPDCEPVVLHAYQPLYEQIASDPDSYRDAARRAAEEQCAAFLADGGGRVPPHRVVVEYGPPEAVLRRYVQERDVELVVIGRGGRNALGNVLMGNTARAILDAVGCDCLIVGNPDEEEGC